MGGGYIPLALSAVWGRGLHAAHTACGERGTGNLKGPPAQHMASLVYSPGAASQHRTQPPALGKLGSADQSATDYAAPDGRSCTGEGSHTHASEIVAN